MVSWTSGTITVKIIEWYCLHEILKLRALFWLSRYNPQAKLPFLFRVYNNNKKKNSLVLTHFPSVTFTLVFFVCYRQTSGMHCFKESYRNCLCCYLTKSFKTFHIHVNSIATWACWCECASNKERGMHFQEYG